MFPQKISTLNGLRFMFHDNRDQKRGRKLKHSDNYPFYNQKEVF